MANKMWKKKKYLVAAICGYDLKFVYRNLIAFVWLLFFLRKLNLNKNVKSKKKCFFKKLFQVNEVS